jgi:predicted MFS family arabinose efflux permease
LLTKMVADWFAGREIITAMALFVNSWPLGLAIGLMSQGPLAEMVGWPLVMYAAAAACATSMILVALAYRPPPGAPQPSKTASLKAAFRIGLTSRELVLTLLAGTVWSFYNVGFILVVSFAPDVLTAAGNSVAEASVIVSIPIWLTLVLAPLGGFLVERSGHQNIALALLLLAYSAVVAAITMWDAPILIFVVMGIVAGTPAGIIMALPARAVRSEVMGPAMGLYFTCYYVGMTALPAAAGWVRDTVGYAGAPLLVAAAILISAFVAFAAFCWVEARASTTARQP